MKTFKPPPWSYPISADHDFSKHESTLHQKKVCCTEKILPTLTSAFNFIEHGPFVIKWKIKGKKKSKMDIVSNFSELVM